MYKPRIFCIQGTDSCLKKLLSYAYALADTTLIYESSDCLSKFYLKNEQYENAFKLQSALYAQILPEDTLKRIACLENLISTYDGNP